MQTREGDSTLSVLTTEPAFAGVSRTSKLFIIFKVMGAKTYLAFGTGQVPC